MTSEDAAAVRGPLLTIVAMSLLLLSRTGLGVIALAAVALIFVAVAQVWRNVD